VSPQKFISKAPGCVVTSDVCVCVCVCVCTLEGKPHTHTHTHTCGFPDTAYVPGSLFLVLLGGVKIGVSLEKQRREAAPGGCKKPPTLHETPT